MRSSTTSVWVTPRAAVGSSMITSWAFCITARATATAWRWPPDSEPTGWRIERTVITDRSARVCLACSSMLISSSCEALQFLAAEEHVLHDVQVVAQGEVLVDGGDPEVGGRLGAVQVDRLALPEDLARVGLPDARDRLDQGGLARAVVADERGHLARGDGQVDVAERPDGAEVLADAAQFEQRRVLVRASSRISRSRRGRRPAAIGGPGAVGGAWCGHQTRPIWCR